MSSYDVLSHVDGIIQLNPVDLYDCKFVSIPWVMFYSYDISASRLKEALHKIAIEYPVLWGRLVSNPTTRVHVDVKKGTGFQLTDVNSELTLLEAVTKSRISNQLAEFPSYPELPHSLVDMNLFEVIDQDVPVFGVKLVHYKDETCSLAVTIHHLIADGQRLANLIVDISRAYRGESLSKMDHDRSRLWPDSFLETIDTGLSPQTFPRECKIIDETSRSFSISEETYSIESIYFPKADIDLLKQKVMAELDAETKYVSQVDIISAINWMLRCELNAIRNGFKEVIKTTADLKISESLHVFYVDLLSNNATLVPTDYFGNAYIWAEAQYSRTSPEQENSDLFSTLVEATKTIRSAVLKHRIRETHLSKLLEVYKAVNQSSESSEFTTALTSYYRMPFSEMDFEGGPPVYNHAMTWYPFWHEGASLSPGGSNGGMILNVSLLKKEKSTAIRSQVLQELFPSAKFLSEMSLTELAQFLTFEPATNGS